MKARTLGRLGVLALALCLITTCLLGGTLAKYTSTVAGEAVATVATWSFTAEGQAATFTDINMKASGAKVLPGDSGTFEVDLAAGADVGVAYTITPTLPTDSNFSFKLGSSSGTAITSGKTISGVLAASGTETVTIYWAYADVTAAAATAGTEQTFAMSIVGEQSSAATAAASVST